MTRFHIIATSHKRYNYIDQLEVDGVVTKNQVVIKKVVHNFYKNLYKEAEQQRPELRLQEATMITEEEKVWLQRHFEEEEIRVSLNLCS